MDQVPPGEAFRPEVFFRQAAERLRGAPPELGRAEGGRAEGLDVRAESDDGLGAGVVIRNAAVLVPVIARGSTLSLLLTRRTAHLSAHAGQISFPGGRIESFDSGPAAAALREAEEEIGLAPEFVRPLGFLDAQLTGSGFRIVPVVARIEPGFHLQPDPGEVAAIFEVPLGFLMSPDNFQLVSREFDGRVCRFYEVLYQDHTIWGATARIIRALYETVYC